MTVEKDQLIEQMQTQLEAHRHKESAAKAMVDELTNANIHLRAGMSLFQEKSLQAITANENLTKELEQLKSDKATAEKTVVQLTTEIARLNRVVMAFDKIMGKAQRILGRMVNVVINHECAAVTDDLVGQNVA